MNDDFISRQAAIRSVCEKECRVLKPCNAECGSIIALRELPYADVVEVVRCKDCKYWNDAHAADGFNSCEMDALIRHEKFFCANGERKDGEQNDIR